LRKETTLGKNTEKKRLRQVEFSLFSQKRRAKQNFFKVGEAKRRRRRVAVGDFKAGKRLRGAKSLR
jgi:hypothetical protein